MSPQRYSRRHEPKSFLDASFVPLENSLLTRAAAIDIEAGEAKVKMSMGPEDSATLLRIADEYRKLAEELHHW